MTNRKIIDTKFIKNTFNVILFMWVISIPFKNALYQISVILLIIFFLIYIMINKDYDYFKSILYKYKDLLLISIFILLSMTISNFINDISNKNTWITEVNYIYRYMFVFIILIYFYSKKFFSEKSLVIFILIALLIQGLDGVFQSIFGHDLFKDRIGSLTEGLTGATSNRNTFSFFMGLGVLISSFLIVKNIIYKKQIFIFILLFSIFFYCTLFSYSRTTWLALFIIFLLFSIFNFKNIKLKHILYILVFIIIVSILFFYFDSLNKRLILLLNGYSSNRYEIWMHALKVIEQKIFFGWGLDSYKIIGLKDITAVHNSVLEILVFLGFFGLVIYTILVYFIMKEIYFYKQFELGYMFIFLSFSSQFEQSITSGKVFISSLVIFMFFVFRQRVK